MLLVEDNADFRDLYGNAMREAGLLVDEVVTVTEAIELAERLRPDIIVLDRHLPDGDGWDVARALKASASEATRHAPIIAFTSHKQRADIVDKAEALMENYDMADTDAQYPRELATQLTACLRRHHDLGLEISKIRDGLITRRLITRRP